jgi:hypothetical protein
MLRSAVIVIGAAAAGGGLAALVLGWFPPAFVFGFWGVLILVGTLFERSRYKALEKTLPGMGWTATPERFIDDQTGKPVTVYVNDAGERRYVQE